MERDGGTESIEGTERAEGEGSGMGDGGEGRRGNPP
jgi:hypothetical protein